MPVSPKSVKASIEHLQKQNQQLRHEVSRLSIAGLQGQPGPAASALSSTQLKEELDNLREQNFILTQNSRGVVDAACMRAEIETLNMTVNRLQVQNQSLRNENSRLKVAGLTEDASGMERFKMKEEIDMLRQQVRSGTDHGSDVAEMERLRLVETRFEQTIMNIKMAFKKEIEGLQALLYRQNANSALSFSVGLKKMAGILKSWLAGTVRGKLLEWRMKAIQFVTPAMPSSRSNLERERDQAIETVRELQTELAWFMSSCTCRIRSPRSPSSPSTQHGIRNIELGMDPVINVSC